MLNLGEVRGGVAAPLEAGGVRHGWLVDTVCVWVVQLDMGGGSDSGGDGDESGEGKRHKKKKKRMVVVSAAPRVCTCKPTLSGLIVAH